MSKLLFKHVFEGRRQGRKPIKPGLAGERKAPFRKNMDIELPSGGSQEAPQEGPQLFQEVPQENVQESPRKPARSLPGALPPENPRRPPQEGRAWGDLGSPRGPNTPQNGPEASQIAPRSLSGASKKPQGTQESLQEGRMREKDAKTRAF